MMRKVRYFLINTWYKLFNAHYQILRKSLCFDFDFYLDHNSDVLESGLDPLVHYVKKGFTELRQPGPLFDSQYYVMQVPSIIEQGQDPLLHFITGGWRAGNKPNPLFDPFFYVQQYPEVDFVRINPLTHFFQQKKEPLPSPYFNPTYYEAINSDIAIPSGHALEHYLLQGIHENRKCSIYFDPDLYLDNTPVLLDNVVKPLLHYIDFGMSEKKSPCPLFDPVYYGKTYNIHGDNDLIRHYLIHGIKADHQPCPWFDPVFYRQQYLLPLRNSTPSFEHYLDQGLGRGLYPNRKVANLQRKPVISIVVPVYNVAVHQLNKCIRSVLYQSYPHWELCLADDCSTRKEILPLLEKWAAKDGRIKTVFLEKNLGISGATNAAAALASGDYLGFLDNDDELTADCLFKVVQNINSERADLYYSDEDLIGEDGRQFSVFYKPGFNPELLLGHNYVTHFVVVEKFLYKKAGGFDSTLDGAQDFDLFLRLSELAEKIVHIPEILYHWRASDSSTSINHEQKEYADAAGRKAVQNALDRRGIKAEVEYRDWKFYYRVKRELATFPSISVCILFSGKYDTFLSWLSRLVNLTQYSDVEYFVILEDSHQEFYLKLQKVDFSENIHILLTTAQKKQSTMYNEAVQQASGQYIVFLSACLQIQEENWIQGLLEYCLCEDVGMVGGRILPFADKEFVSTLPDMSQRSDLYYARFLQESSRHMNGLHLAQNVFALSWNLAMIERQLFLEMGGFADDLFSELFADCDLCFRLQSNGLENLYTPFVSGRLLQSEEKQISFMSGATESVKKLFQKKWQEKLQTGDPYYNRNVLEQGGVKEDDFLVWYLGELSV